MIRKIAILITILSIFGKDVGAQNSNYISEYIDQFKNDTFDEFNLICYISLRGIIRSIVLYIFNNPGEPLPHETLSDIKNINYMLHRVIGWKKYLIHEENIWTEYSNIISWRNNPSDIGMAITMLEDVQLTLNLNKFFNLNITTPLGIRFFNILQMQIPGDIDEMFINTFIFCKKNLNAISAPTANLEQYLSMEFTDNKEIKKPPVTSVFGCTLLLIKENYIHEIAKLHTQSKKVIYLVYIIHDAIQDIYKGLVYTMNKINILDLKIIEMVRKTNSQSTDVTLLKMIISVYSSAIHLTQLIYNMMDIKGVIEEIKFLNLTTTGSYDNKYNYYDFQRDFEKKWLQIFLSGQTSTYDGPGSSTISEEPVYDGSILPDGVLFENGKVKQSIIGYYAMFDISGIHLNDIDYRSNTDDRIILLMELNAWMKIFYQTLLEMNELLIRNRNRKTNNYEKPKFEENLKNIQYYQKYFK